MDCDRKVVTERKIVTENAAIIKNEIPQKSAWRRRNDYIRKEAGEESVKQTCENNL